MSEELTTVEVADEIKAVMEDENFVPSPEDIECYGKHQIKPSEILPCPLCGSEYLQFGDWERMARMTKLLAETDVPIGYRWKGGTTAPPRKRCKSKSRSWKRSATGSERHCKD